MHRLEVPAPHAPPFAVGTFDEIGPLSRAEFPHRHTFHELVHVTGGTGAHVVDLAAGRCGRRTSASSRRARCTSGPACAA